MPEKETEETLRDKRLQRHQTMTGIEDRVHDWPCENKWTYIPAHASWHALSGASAACQVMASLIEFVTHMGSGDRVCDTYKLR